jgi:hypothetical protein
MKKNYNGEEIAKAFWRTLAEISRPGGAHLLKAIFLPLEIDLQRIQQQEHPHNSRV